MDYGIIEILTELSSFSSWYEKYIIRAVGLFKKKINRNFAIYTSAY